jgi:hypothetical protein
MILEVADIRIQPGQQAAFDETITCAARNRDHQRQGCCAQINKGVNRPNAIC